VRNATLRRNRVGGHHGRFPITSTAGDAVAKLIIQLVRAGDGDPERLCGGGLDVLRK
jgi:hypothetical protein